MAINEQKYNAILSELLSDPNAQFYWARKARLICVEGELSPLEFKLLEFDIALKFSQAKDLAKSAEKIFQADKSSEKVRQRIGQLFSVLLNTTDKQFSTELVAKLPMESLQELFFFAFPDQRSSPKGSLQVYLTVAANQPKSLATIATKLFAYYLGASAEFQRAAAKAQQLERDEVTPMDAILFLLFPSLTSAQFGDLSVHNIAQIFNILLHNCFADSVGRLSEDFYSQSGISCLAGIVRPSASWHFCVSVLAHLFSKRGQTQLAQSLQPFPESSKEMMSSFLDRLLADSDKAHELLKSAEFVRLAFLWAMASPIHMTQLDVGSQLVSLPANMFWVDPDGFDHFWLYNLDAEEEDSPAEIEEPQREKTLRVDPCLAQPIRLLGTLFATGPIAERELAAHQAEMPNGPAIAVMALMATRNWARAAQLLEQFEANDNRLPAIQRTIFRFQKMQTQIAVRQLDKAFALCLELLQLFPESKDREEQQQHPELALVVAQEPTWIALAHRSQIPLYLRLCLFHICWLAFAKAKAKCRTGGSANEEDFLLLALFMLVQSFWVQSGFGLFEQLLEHVSARERFHCPGLLQWMNNPIIAGQLLGLDHVLMDITSAGEGPQPPEQIFKEILEGKQKMAADPCPVGILNKFVEENGQRIAEQLIRFHEK